MSTIDQPIEHTQFFFSGSSFSFFLVLSIQAMIHNTSYIPSLRAKLAVEDTHVQRMVFRYYFEKRNQKIKKSKNKRPQ